MSKPAPKTRDRSESSQRHHHSDGGHHHHRRRHEKHFPPQEYSDLTRTDLSLLAPCLLPQTRKETVSSYEKRTKQLIADLPAHLHCKHPLLSAFCSVHNKLSPLPITSLFNSIRGQIEDIPEVWGSLLAKKQLAPQKREMIEIVLQLSNLWLGAKVFKQKFGREPRHVFASGKVSKCVACTMARMAGDFQTQVAMAGLFIGRVSEGVWESSKRIAWFLEWTCARLPGSRKEEAKRLVWEIGKKFYLSKVGADELKRKRSKNKLEPAEERLQEGKSGPGTASYPCELDPDRDEVQERSRGPRKMVDAAPHGDAGAHELRRRSDGAELSDLEYAIKLSLEEEEQRLAMEREVWDHRPSKGKARASSMYSCTTQGDRPQTLSIAEDIDQIVALYSDSVVQNEDDNQYSAEGSNPFVEEAQGRHSPETEPPRPKKSRLESMISKTLRDWS